MNLALPLSFITFAFTLPPSLCLSRILKGFDNIPISRLSCRIVQCPKLLHVHVWRVLGASTNNKKFECLEVRNRRKKLEEEREELDEHGYFGSKNKTTKEGSELGPPCACKNSNFSDAQSCLFELLPALSARPTPVRAVLTSPRISH